MTHKMIIHLINNHALGASGLSEYQMLILRRELKRSIRCKRPWSDGHGTIINPEHIVYIEFVKEQ